IEANPELVKCLRQTFADRPSVKVLHAAASDRDEEVEFFLHPECSGSSSMSASWAPRFFRPTGANSLHRVVVPGRRLDTLIPEVLGFEPLSVLIKIDVEGFEDKVMRGAERLLTRARWWRAMLEYGSEILAAE